VKAGASTAGFKNAVRIQFKYSPRTAPAFLEAPEFERMEP
jgi:hypothetical protein